MLKAELENGQQIPQELQVWGWQQCSRVWACCESQGRKEVLEWMDGLCLLLAHPHGAAQSQPGELACGHMHLLGLSTRLCSRGVRSGSFATSLSHFSYI